MENEASPITLQEIKKMLDEHLAMFIEQSEGYVFTSELAPISCAICEITRTLLLIEQTLKESGKSDFDGIVKTLTEAIQDAVTAIGDTS